MSKLRRRLFLALLLLSVAAIPATMPGCKHRYDPELRCVQRGGTCRAGECCPGLSCLGHLCT
jgi:hypothetical protein